MVRRVVEGRRRRHGLGVHGLRPGIGPRFLRHGKRFALVRPACAAKATICTSLRSSPCTPITASKCLALPDDAGDNWDYDATQPLLLATLTIDGAQRRVIMQPNKNGFFYVIDRENGKLISAKPFAPVNWATGIDANGRPVENPAARQLKDAALVRPSAEGAHNWNPISFSPTTGLVYLAVLEDASIHAIIPNWKINLHDQTTGSDRAYRGKARDEYLKMKITGNLLAWDPVAQKEAWRVELPDPKSGGTLATAGNLVFHGRADGKFSAYRATDGKPLWEFDAGVGIAAAPMTFSVDGTQYIAVQSGWGGPQVLGHRPPGAGHVGPGKLMVFQLGATATLPPYQHVVQPVPMPTFKLAASKAEIEEGRKLFANTCARCHGGEVDQRRRPCRTCVTPRRPRMKCSRTSFWEARGKEYGMPSFTGDITSAQVRLIHAYILDRARESAQADAAPKK